MKNAWPIKKLGEVCDIEMGQSPDGRSYNSQGKGTPLINGPVEFSGGPFGRTIRSKFTNQPTKLCTENDLILCVRGSTTGRTNIAAFDACIGRGVAAIRAKEYQPWINYFIVSNRQEIYRLGTGATFPNVSRSMLGELRLPMPPVSEQERLVCILDRAFAAIATARANTEKNLQNARAMFQSELQCVFAGECNAFPIVKLSEITSDITDGDHLPPPKSATGVPFITIGNILKGTRQIDFSDTFKVPRDYFESLKPNRKPRKGDVLFTVTGSFGIPVLVDSSAEFCFQRHIGLVRPKHETDSKWLYYLMSSPLIFRQADERASGAAQRTVSLQSLRNFGVPKTPAPQQQTTARRLDLLSSQMDRLAGNYQERLFLLDELKASLLHIAFTGRL